VTTPGEQIAYRDAYAQSVDATVRHVEIGESTLVVLDRTVFYPGWRRTARRPWADPPDL
jgi:Ser-tRNA(Ala) deacylase AlaX